MSALERSQETPPVAVAQEALWYQSRLAPHPIPLNEAISIRKTGPLDVGALRRAFTEIVRRHEAWRTTFEVQGGSPVQIVGPPPPLALDVLDLSDLMPEEAEREAVRAVAELARVPYDLRQGPLVRPRLVRLADEHRLYLAMHHLVFDGVSVAQVVLAELAAVYEAFAAGRPSPLPGPGSSYGDYARWEQEWIEGPRAAQRIESWSRHLAGAPPLALPLDHPRPAQRRFRGGTLGLEVSPAVVNQLRVAGQERGATLFHVLAGTWAVLMARYAGQGDVVFAGVANLRRRPEHQAVVGYGITPFVIRAELGDDPRFGELVLRVRNEVLDALDRLVPFERLVRALRPDTAAGANALYGTMIVLEPSAVSPDGGWSIHQMDAALGDAVGNAKLDLELQLDVRRDGGLAGRLIYDRDLFDAPTVRRLTEHWRRVLEAVADDPDVVVSQIQLLNQGERRRQLVAWNATATLAAGAGRPVDELLGERASEDSTARAVCDSDQQLSRGELERTAACVAGGLIAAGVRPGDVVALCVEPSTALVAGALGVLRVGAAHLLLDPQLPVEQQETMLADAGVILLVGDGRRDPPRSIPRVRLAELLEVLPRAGPPATPKATCCVTYGPAAPRALGVPTTHAAVVNLAVGLRSTLGLNSVDTVLVLRSMLFASPALLWAWLLTGATVVLAPAELDEDGRGVSQLISATGVTLAPATPSTWRGLIDSGLRSTRGVRALSCGGPLSEELKGEILKRCRLLWNGYGAAETTACSTLARILAGQPVTLGRPLANARAYVVDRNLQPVPVGVTGELLVAGTGIGSGYLNHPELTATRFIADPFAPGPAFRTGERARWRPDGELEWVGLSG